jgi:predicted RNA-binding Zn-ribbon protein involved in translation (DUF1610 family)
VYQLDDFDAVPRARQAYAQAQSGTIRDASFGFDHSAEDESPFESRQDAVWINKAQLQEHSLVLVGAVPGSKIAGTRNIPAGEVLRLVTELEHGEISLPEALAAVARVAGESEVRQMHSHAKQDGGGVVNHSHQGVDGMHAHSGLMPAMRLGREEPEGEERADVTDASSGMTKQSPVINKCPKCGAEITSTAKYCPDCGAKIARASTEDETRALLAEIGARE